MDLVGDDNGHYDFAADELKQIKKPPLER